MFKLPSLCLNTSSCWQQQEIPWSAVRLESAIFLESKQRVCQLEIIFCLLGLLVAEWWSHVTAADNSATGNRKQPEKWFLDSASDNRSLRFLTLPYCYCVKKRHLGIASETFKAAPQHQCEYVGPSKRSSNILIKAFREKNEQDTQRNGVSVQTHSGGGGQDSYPVSEEKQQQKCPDIGRYFLALMSQRLGEISGSFRWDEEGKCGHKIMPASSTQSRGCPGWAEVGAQLGSSSWAPWNPAKCTLQVNHIYFFSY